MQRLVSIILLMLILTQVGCVTQPDLSPGILVTRFHRVNTGSRPPSMHNFIPGETPTVYVYGCGGQTVTIKLYSVSAEREITNETIYIARHKDKYWGFSDLSKGSYRAVLEIGNTPVDETLFTVSQ